MGGNALKTLKGKGRMSPEEYERVKEEVLKQLRMWYAQVRIPPQAFGKLDHGDVDVLCLPHHSTDAPIDPVQQLGSTEVVRNAHLISFEYLGRQIDLTHVRTQQALDFKLVFNAYRFVGKVLVSMCKPVGLLINQKQLAVRLPHLSQNLFLTDDIWQVLQFLGLSGDVWKRGFSDPSSLCRWFASSQFFNLDNVKLDPKILDTLMGTQSSCHSQIKSMHDRVHSADSVFATSRTCYPSKEDVLAAALSFFNKEHEHQALLSMRDRSQEIKLKFNGELVMQWTGCSRKDIGCLLRAFKERFSLSDILSMDKNTIKQEVLSLFSTLLVSQGGM